MSLYSLTFARLSAALGGAALLGLACFGPAASAQDAAAPTTLGHPPSSAALGSSPLAVQETRRPLWELGMGVGGLYLPDYRGSDQGRAYFVPVPYLIYRGSWFKSDRDGTRALLVHTERVTLDLSVGGSAPSQNRDNTARSGMPNLPGTFEVGPNLNLTLAQTPSWQFDLRLPLRAALSLERSPQFIGTTFSPNLNLDFKQVAGGWNVGLLTGPLFADSKNHGFFYNVAPSQATSMRASYRSPGGYSGWRVLASTSRQWKGTWVGAFVRYDALRGAAFEDSPLVRRNSSLTGGVAIAWVFASSSTQAANGD